MGRFLYIHIIWDYVKVAAFAEIPQLVRGWTKVYPHHLRCARVRQNQLTQKGS